MIALEESEHTVQKKMGIFSYDFIVNWFDLFQ